MARIFITGSADGLGRLAAEALIARGHEVVLHARNAARGAQALKNAPGAAGVLVADLSSIGETKALATQANECGRFDAVVHNAGVYQVPRDATGAEGWPLLLAVNTLAPYILTCLMRRPKRLIYMSSGLHRQGNPDLEDIVAGGKGGSRSITYSDTKLHVVLLALAVARHWPDVFSNAVDPGWVPTKMGGPGAPGSLERGYETQVWLAAGEAPAALVSGGYFHHMRQTAFLPVAAEVAVQERFLEWCRKITGVTCFGSPDKGQ